MTKEKTEEIMAHAGDRLQGTFEANARGFGFVTVEGMEQDLFIPPDRIGNAFYGDSVEVKVLPEVKGEQGRDRRQEAEIIRILNRNVTEVVGTFERTKHAGFVVPDNKKIQHDIYINRQDSMGAVDGHKVVAKITDYGSPNKNPQGKVTEILGHKDDPGVDVLSIVRAYDLPGDFPADVKEEVEKIPDHVDAGALRGERKTEREDWRKVPTVTIDGPSTKDIDDAISVERTENGGYRLGVHIADVSEYVSENSALDREALHRATSNYLVDRVIPMLPHELSNGICSLNQGEDRFALSCIMDLDAKGKLTGSRIAMTIIRSDAKLSYPGVMALFDRKDDSEIVNALQAQNVRGIKTRALTLCRMLRRGKKLSALLERQRTERGSIDFDFTESEIVLDEKGKPIDIREHERNDATEMIENFMLLANACVAKTFFEKKIPFVYRTHAKPDEEKITALRDFIEGYGYKLEGGESGVSPKEISALLESLQGKPEEAMIQTMTLRSMQRASYTTECGGHYGLALKYYCHFTSPIRRYPDLQIHRIIKEYLRGQLTKERQDHYNEILPEVCRQSSEMERRADEAERETDKQKKAEYMRAREGDDFTGVISGVTSFGLFVELPNTVEGLVSISELTDDYYNYDEKRLALVGERTGKTWSLGQQMHVICSGADVSARTVDFIPAKDELGPAVKKGRAAFAGKEKSPHDHRKKEVRRDRKDFRKHKGHSPKHKKAGKH